MRTGEGVFARQGISHYVVSSTSLLLSCYRAAVSEKENSSILAGDILGLGLPQLPGIQTHVVSLMPEREPATFA